jgi:hypothetical protein
MEAGAPQEPDGHASQRRRARLTVWCEGAGVLLGLATVLCCLFHVVSRQQAVAMGLPAVLLIVGGLIAATAPDPAAGRRFGFQAGFLAGSFMSIWRSLFHRDKGLVALPVSSNTMSAHALCGSCGGPFGRLDPLPDRRR